MIRELEEIPLPLRQRSQRLPSLEGRALHRANTIRGLYVIEESTQGGKDLLGRQQDHASLAGTHCGDLEGHRPGPLLAEQTSESLRQAPFDPRDIFSVRPVRGQEFEPGNAVPTRDRTCFPPNRRLVFERALPMHADDEGVRLRAQGKGLEDLDGTVVTEEAVAQDLEFVEERRGHGELEPFHRVWLTGKPEPTYTCGPSISAESVMAEKPFHAQTSVITCDMQGIVQEYAADAGDLFGWSPAEVVGKLSVATFHLPENVPTLVPRLLKEAVENGKFEEEVTLRRKDGDVFRARLTVRPVYRDGKQVGFMGMTHPLEPPRRP